MLGIAAYQVSCRGRAFEGCASHGRTACGTTYTGHPLPLVATRRAKKMVDGLEKHLLSQPNAPTTTFAPNIALDW